MRASNPFRKGSKAHDFIKLAKPDEDGFADKVGIKTLEKHGLGFGNGGSWCRDDGTLAKHYNVKRHKQGNRIVGVSLHGQKKTPIEKPIPAAIRKKITAKRCVVLGVSNVECDHKDGRRDDPRLSDASKVKLSDFQPLSKAANNAKRQHCKNCRKTDKRFDARQLGYKKGQWKGNGIYHGSCIGCYWHDPLRFNKEMTK